MMERDAMTDGGKEIYEALQTLNSYLNEAEEQLLVDLVEKIRTSLRKEAAYAKAAGAPSGVEATLRNWIEFDAAVKEPEPQVYPN
jgi:hypothetical protein